MRPALRRSLWIAVIAVLGVLLLAGGGAAYLQTASGRAWLAATLSRALSSPDMTVALSPIEGSIPFDLRVRTISVADRDGTWLTVTDAAIDIAARDLLRRKVTLRRLGASEIALQRLPAASTSQTEPSDGGFALPALPVDIAIDALTVPRIHLAEPVIGESVTASLDGRGSLTGAGAEAHLSIERGDGQTGHARLVLDARRDGPIALNVDVAEPSGLLLQRVLGRDAPVPLTISIDGTGPLDDWRGALHARAGDVAGADATFTIKGEDGHRITSNGTLAVTGLLPASLATIAPRPLDYAASARLQGDIITIESFEVTGAAVALKAQGRYDQAAGTLAGEATGTVADLAALEPIAGMPLSGAATVTAKVDGPLDKPRAHIDLSAQNPRSGDMGVAAASASTDLVLEGGTWRLSGTGALEGLALPMDGTGVPTRIDWTIAAQSDESFGRLVLDDLRLNGDGLTVAASGTLDTRDQAPRLDGKARIEAANLARFRDLASLPLAGQLALDIRAETQADAITATIDGQTRNFAGINPAVDALLGGEVRLEGTVTRAGSGAIAVKGTKMTGAHATANLDGELSADFGQVAGTLGVALPRLAVLSQPLATPVEGAATATARIGGTLAQPRIDARADATGLRFGEQRLDKIGIDIALADAMKPAGTLAATFKADALEGRADAAFERTTPDTLSVSKLSLAAPGTTIDGALDVKLDKMLVAGALNAKVADLRAWSKLAGTRLAGAAEARAKLADKNGQSADIDASLRDVRLDDAGVALTRVRLEARLADLLGSPSGRATVDASGVAVPDLRADTVRLTAQSTKPGVFNVTADAKGALRPDANPSPLSLSAASEIAVTGNEQRLRVTRLTGQIGSHRIESQTPLVVAAGPDRLRFEGLDLRIDRGRLSGSGSRNGEQLALKVDARDLPLELIETVVPQQRIAGRLGASISLSGTATRPDGQFDAQIRDLRADSAGKDMPPLAMTARGTWKDGRLDLSGRLEGPAKTGLDLTAALPLRLDPKTMTPAVPGDGALAATARGTGRLESWSNVLPLGEDRIAGGYDVDIAVRGTVASPEVGGKLTIRDGRYVNFGAGTELRNLAVTLVGNDRHFTLEQFSATDAANGKISGGGAIDLAATPGPAVDFHANFTEFQVARRDDFTGTADGELKFAGPLTAATLSGHVRMSRAEIRIPDKLPPSIVRLDVVEIDSRDGGSPSKPEQAAAEDSAIRLDLDLDVPARAFVRGRGLDSEWKGKAHIAGTVDKPAVTGRLETVRGDFSFLAKRFVLANSTIDFVGGDNIDPTLNIVAEHKSSTIVAQVIITGTSSDPSIRLTSQPEMPQDEILSQVLFGRGAGEITPMQGLELAQAAATLAGRGGPGIMDRVRNMTGLDRLDISSGETSASGTSGTKLSAGEYVSDKVFVGVEQGATSDSARTKVEVEVLPNVTVESSVGANSSAGVGVNWKWDY
jgi:translocation and assembly module TamB